MKRVLILGALLAVLLFLERGAEPSAADAGETHRPLVSIAEQESLALTGFVLTSGGDRHEYRRSAGTWRCVTAFGAVAHPREIADLTRALITATAAWRAPSPTPEAVAAFGLDAPRRVEFIRSDTGGWPLVFHLGTSVASPKGTSVFVRREGFDGVWELDAEGLEPLSVQPSAGFPPLLDQRLTAGCPLDPSRGVARAFIDFEGGASLEIQPEEAEGGVRWILSDGAAEHAVLPFRLAGWLAFLQRSPYAGFTNPQTSEERGLDPPAARVTLFPPEVPPIELVLGREVEGEVYLLNRTSGMLLLLQPGSAALIAPDARALTEAGGANPWETWLR